MLKDIIRNILSFPFSHKQKRLATARPPLSEDEFTREVSDAGGDREAAFMVYRKLSEWIYVTGFTPYPEDSLSQIYGIAEEELDEDLILSILNDLDIHPPSKERLAAFGSVDTPLQIAQLTSLARIDGAHAGAA